MQQWPPFLCRGTLYDLTHLNSITCEFCRHNNGEKEEKYKVKVIYRAHCFTRGLRKNEEWDSIDENFIYENQDRKEKRIFDIKRYELSKNLPMVMENLDKTPCYITEDKIFFKIENIHGEVNDYEVYFDLFRGKDRGLIILDVRTAFLRDESYESKQPEKLRMGFWVILHNVYNHKAIKVPKNKMRRAPL